MSNDRFNLQKEVGARELIHNARRLEISLENLKDGYVDLEYKLTGSAMLGQGKQFGTCTPREMLSMLLEEFESRPVEDGSDLQDFYDSLDRDDDDDDDDEPERVAR